MEYYPWHRMHCEDDVFLTAVSMTAELFRLDDHGFIMDRAAEFMFGPDKKCEALYDLWSKGKSSILPGSGTFIFRSILFIQCISPVVNNSNGLICFCFRKNQMKPVQSNTVSGEAIQAYVIILILGL